MFYFGTCKTFCGCSCYCLPRTSFLESWSQELLHLCDQKCFQIWIPCNTWSNLMQEIQFLGWSNLTHAHWNYCYPNKYSISATRSYLLSAGCDVKYVWHHVRKCTRPSVVSHPQAGHETGPSAWILCCKRWTYRGLSMRLTYYHRQKPPNYRCHCTLGTQQWSL